MKLERIRLKDKEFELLIPEKEIKKAVDVMAYQIHHDYVGRTPVFIVVLNGAFMFAADLIKNVELDCDMQFVKYQSYSGTKSTGQVSQLMGLNVDLTNKHVIILEDIIDTGTTYEKIYSDIEKLNPAAIRLATIFFKPANLKQDIEPDYYGIELGPEFVVGYGLDYNGYGRNLKSLYKLIS